MEEEKAGEPPNSWLMLILNRVGRMRSRWGRYAGPTYEKNAISVAPEHTLRVFSVLEKPPVKRRCRT
jgi:hypothetical protein